MKTENLERYLDSFGKYVVQQSRTNLTKGKKNVDKTLYNSIKFEVSTGTDGLSIEFYMADYGTFVDKGVSGASKKRSFKNWEGKDAPSPYSYTTKGPPIDILSKWIKKKGIKPEGTGRGRSKNTGQFVSGLAYLISKKIKREGIKSISFFSKPLSLWYDKLQDDFLKAFKKDVSAYITTFTKK